MKIILSGGGTLGPVTPLLAIYEALTREYKDATFIWIGTKGGPEKEIVEKAGIPFIAITSGKLRRYISFWNVIDIFRIVIGFFRSIGIMFRYSPDACISAGGYVSVPLHWAAWLFGVPSWIHQQDVQVGLSNRFMAPFARIITTSLESQMKLFPKRKVKWIGNPVRNEILSGSKDRAMELFDLKEDLPIIFATGGGTGSLRVNQMIVEAVGHLKGHAQIIHLTGKERPQELAEKAQKHFDYYQVHQFFSEEMKHAYAAADIVISRGGFGTLSELAALSKPAILIPKHGHQVQNVSFLAEAGAVEVVDETTKDGNYLARLVKDLISDKNRMITLGSTLNKTMPLATETKIVGILKSIL
ncbi:MAG: UDP-N-acetylglucosamine--N-acetylmuramyl-(pentapeptide) pyrophosphoryl-undecaprenol N-acetylglucosamine transferase [Candidatus Magasanikbacteria bacterium]